MLAAVRAIALLGAVLVAAGRPAIAQRRASETGRLASVRAGLRRWLDPPPAFFDRTVPDWRRVRLSLAGWRREAELVADAKQRGLEERTRATGDPERDRVSRHFLELNRVAGTFDRERLVETYLRWRFDTRARARTLPRFWSTYWKWGADGVHELQAGQAKAMATFLGPTISRSSARAVEELVAHDPERPDVLGTTERGYLWAYLKAPPVVREWLVARNGRQPTIEDLQGILRRVHAADPNLVYDQSLHRILVGRIFSPGTPPMNPFQGQPAAQYFLSYLGSTRLLRYAHDPVRTPLDFRMQREAVDFTRELLGFPAKE